MNTATRRQRPPYKVPSDMNIAVEATRRARQAKPVDETRLRNMRNQIFAALWYSGYTAFEIALAVDMEPWVVRKAIAHGEQQGKR